MASVVANMAIGSFDHRLTINVRIRKRFFVRIWLATQLFKFGAWIMGANINTEMEDSP